MFSFAGPLLDEIPGLFGVTRDDNCTRVIQHETDCVGSYSDSETWQCLKNVTTTAAGGIHCEDQDEQVVDCLYEECPLGGQFRIHSLSLLRHYVPDIFQDLTTMLMLPCRATTRPSVVLFISPNGEVPWPSLSG